MLPAHGVKYNPGKSIAIDNMGSQFKIQTVIRSIYF